MDLFMILFGAAFINNYILTRFLGLCPYFGVSKKTETAFGMGVSVIFVMVVATTITYPFYTYVLLPNNLTYLQIIVFILTIASIVQFIEMFLKKVIPVLYSALGIFLPLIAVNCAIMGVSLINIDSGHTFIEAMVNSAGAGLGFLLAILLLAGVREKSENNPDIPKLFRGFPFALFAAGLMSIAFMGFQGLIG